jgi:hypothetical protein
LCGQELFIGPSSLASLSQLNIHMGKIPQSLLEARHLRPFWNSFPLPDHKPSLVRRLRQLGYQLLNGADDHPDSFTIVHLAAGPEQLFASVKLAVDGELEELTQQADSRVSIKLRLVLSAKVAFVFRIFFG